jgi:hypothetical protein
MRITQVLSYVLLAACFSCNLLNEDVASPFSLSKKEHQLWYVADHRVDCIGEGAFQCMLIKEKPEEEWTIFYGDIQGFDYEEGYEYVIEVSIKKIDKPIEDGASLKYTLVKIWHKE